MEKPAAYYIKRVSLNIDDKGPEVVLSILIEVANVEYKNFSIDWHVTNFHSREVLDCSDFDVCISTSSSAPTGKTYYAKLGSFYNDASGNITNITNDWDFQTGEVYDSGWFAVAATTVYTKSHNLGTTKVLALVYSASDSSGTGMQKEAGNIVGGTYGINLYNITTTQVTIRPCAAFHYIDSVRAGIASGYARIILIALE